VLSDLPAYQQRNPFIVHADGTAETGSRLTLRMRTAGGRAVTLRPTVLESQDGSRLRWRGRLGMPGVMDADHSFTIEARPGGGSRLRQEETFRGVLVPFVARYLDRGTLPGFAAMDGARSAGWSRRRPPALAVDHSRSGAEPSSGLRRVRGRTVEAGAGHVDPDAGLPPRSSIAVARVPRDRRREAALEGPSGRRSRPCRGTSVGLASAGHHHGLNTPSGARHAEHQQGRGEHPSG
jgi:hypothetical protein